MPFAQLAPFFALFYCFNKDFRSALLICGLLTLTQTYASSTPTTLNPHLDIQQHWYTSQLSPSLTLALSDNNDVAQKEITTIHNGGYSQPLNQNLNLFMEAGGIETTLSPANNQVHYHLTSGVRYLINRYASVESRLTQMSLKIDSSLLNQTHTNLGVNTSYRLLTTLDVNAGLEMQLSDQLLYLGVNYRF